MIIIIPLGGLGLRFKQNGYTKPKALINVLGKPILYYLLDNLELSTINFIYIPYNKEYYNYRLDHILINQYPNINFKFLCLEENTQGAAQTINIALKQLNIPDEPILCLDGDNFYSINIVSLWDSENKVITFKDDNNKPIYSYIKIENEKIIDIMEKEQISKYACTGAYGFSSYKQLLEYTQIIIDNNIKYKNEFYISTVIGEMLKNNIEFIPSIIDIKDWHCLGTPIQIKQFCNNYPKISCLDDKQKIKNMRICFDLDNTLVTYTKIKNDYSTVEPIIQNINFLKYMKTFGHTIIIYTARRMKTHRGNVGKTLSDIGKLTFDMLEKFDIPFDEIYFGKPYADIYIDDLALNCFEDLEKSLGFYMDTIDARDFNELCCTSIDVYIKKSNNLSGEIYYYNNIPLQLKDLFPVMIEYDKNNEWYTIEKINGLTATTMYLSELLSLDNLKHIMNSIKRIQSHKIIEETNINIYENYSKKLEKRYNSYDYLQFPHSNQIYEEINEELKLYESENKGIVSVIHGDTVMTNIIINNFGKIKLIDMRGKVGDTLTIYGDWLYDWAKLYQSVIGYDKILQDKYISITYEKTMIDYFRTHFIELYSQDDFDNLKIITKSLLFTLIPLHNNTKCEKYYELISSIYL